MPNPLVSTEWLAERLERAGHRRRRRLLVPADHEPRPGGGVSSPATSRARCASTSTPSRTRLRPCPTCCRRRRISPRRCGAMGIGDGMKIVVYDGAGLFSAPRVWWTFRVFGARDVSILDGGFPAWTAKAGRSRTGPAKPRAPRHFTRAARPSAVADLSDVRRALETARRRSSTRARPTASAARRRSRARACAPAICRAASTCPSPRSSRTAGSNRRRSRRAVAKAGVDLEPADRHELRLRRLGRDPGAGARDDRPPGEGALRRLLGRMGRGGRTCRWRRVRPCGCAQPAVRQSGSNRPAAGCPMPPAVSAGSG